MRIRWLRMLQGYEQREKAVPRTFQMLVMGLFAYFIVNTLGLSGFRLISILVIAAGFAVSYVLALQDSNPAYVFFYIFLMPLFFFRSVIPAAGLMAFSGFILLALFWIFFEPGPVTVVTDYRIPEETTPAESAFLLSRDIGPQELVATIFSLMRRGYLKVGEEGGRIMFYKTAEYENDLTLLSYEKFTLDRLFMMPNIDIMMQTGIVYSCDQFPDKIDSELVMKNLSDWADNFRTLLLDSLRKEKPVLSPVSFETKPVFMVIAGVYLLAGITSLGIKGSRGSPNNFAHFVFLMEPFMMAVLSLVFAFVPILPLTRFGKEIYAKVLGFREFMRRVEKPRLIWLLNEEKMDVFELLNYLYALNLLSPLEWALEFVKGKGNNEQALLFTKMLKEVHFQWGRGKNLRQEQIKYRFL